MLILYLVLVAGEYFYESDLVHDQLAERQINQIQQQLLRMQQVVESAQAIQDVERIEQEVVLAAIDMNVMVYILMDANSRIRFANHTVWRDSNAMHVIDGYDIAIHHAVVQSSQPQVILNQERLTIQAYYPIDSRYPGGIELIYLESDLAPLIAEASTELQQRFLRVWGLGALLLIAFTLLLYYLLILPFKSLSRAAKQIGTADFKVSIPWSSTEVLSLQAHLQHVHDRLCRVVKQLNDSELRWLFAVEGSRNGIWDWDLSTGELFLSDRWKEMVGYQPDELDGVFQTWEARLHPEDKQAVLDSLDNYISGKAKSFESVHRLMHRDGHYVWVLDRGMLVDWDHLGRPTRMLGLHVDVSASERHHAAISEIVKQSSSGHRMLPDAFIQQLTQFLSEPVMPHSWSALFSVEVEFIGLHPSLAPQELERLYTQLGARLSSYFGEHVVAHVQLGRFSLLARTMALDVALAGRKALALAAELRQLTSRPFQNADHHLILNANVGICLIDSFDTLEADEVMRRADLAVQHAKSLEQAGCAFYSGELEAVIGESDSMHQDLALAIAENQLTIMFQPVMDSSGQIVSAEALSRWHLPNGKIVPVNDFIGLAERHGLIASLDLYVVRHVCQSLQQLRQQGVELPRISLNISSLSFYQVDFVDKFVAIVRSANLTAHQIGVELNEQALNGAELFVKERITKLTNAGVTVTLDNFGAGNASLSYLMKYPISEVKLDMKCCETIGDSLCWPQALIQAAQPFKVRVVAKGIESVQQQQMFAALGCMHYQGYGMSRALSLSDFKRLIYPRPLLRSV
ncbi:EAL domain-containing protein [Shewanella sp. A25]|nr:EAL domain-containing protein [Shewanella shenzhenensis]